MTRSLVRVEVEGNEWRVWNQAQKEHRGFSFLGQFSSDGFSVYSEARSSAEDDDREEVLEV